MKIIIAPFLLLLLACSPPQLIILEDYHTATYFEVMRFVETQPPGQSYSMLNFDMHSDSNLNPYTHKVLDIMSSQETPLESRHRLMKERNYFEVFSWLDPLLGEIVTDYTWVTLVGEEVFPMDQRFEYHYQRTDPTHWDYFHIEYWTRDMPYPQEPTILTVDLDAFQPYTPEEGRLIAQEFWKWAAGHQWALITSCVSTPYQDGIPEALEILHFNLEAMVENGFQVDIKTQESYGLDLSRPARMAYHDGKLPPLIDWQNLPEKTSDYIGQQPLIQIRHTPASQLGN